MVRLKIKTIYSLIFVAFAMLPFHTQALEKVTGTPVLTISGNIGVTNKSDTAQFDMKMLRAFPSKTIKTETPWTDGVVTFKGILARDLLKAIKAKGKQIHAQATDEYTVTIPIEDFDRHDVIFAYMRDGEMLPTDEQGPLWVIYPWSEKPELNIEQYHSRSIWQLVRIEVE